MKKQKAKRLGFQLLIIAIVTGIFTWLYVTNFESVDKVVLFKNATDAFWGLPTEINLPFKIHRVFDILVIIFCVYAITKILQYFKKSKNKEEILIIGLLLGIVFGIVLEIAFLAKSDLTYTRLPVYIWLAIVFLVGLIAAHDENIISGLKFGLIIGLSAGIMTTLITGIEISFAISFIIGLIIALSIIAMTTVTIVLGNALKFLYSRKTWDGILNLLNGLSFND